MKNLLKFFLTVLVCICFVQSSQALEVVYPKKDKVDIYSSSTFFIGSSEPGVVLTINKKPVKVWENGSFVEVVPLVSGKNTFVLESNKGNETKILTYVITKPQMPVRTVSEAPLECVPDNQYIFARIISNNTPLRSDPDDNGKRLTHLPQDTIIMIDAKKGNYFRVNLTPDKYAWVAESRIVNYSTINEKVLAEIADVSLTEDKNYNYIKMNLDHKVPYILSPVEHGFELSLYGIKGNSADSKVFKPVENIKSMAIATVESEGVSKFFIETNQKEWGYNAEYEDNSLVFKLRKIPKINEISPLKGITIAIDAGHGGKDSGAVGPTGGLEKDINFDIAAKLKKELENAGANVVLTRPNDTNVPLYDRPEVARKNDALIMVSIHANALPDGLDPYKKRGTSVFYYNDEAKGLAQTLKEQLLDDLGTKDDGTNRSSFVLTRPTMPLSVLIEVAYIINPEEYILLMSDDFRQKTAVSIKTGLENYLLKNRSGMK
jgi:N-acetylmuramoyl-L-alanine amidase